MNDCAMNGHAMSGHATSGHGMSGHASVHRDYGRGYDWYAYECHAHGRASDSAFLHMRQRAPRHIGKQE